MASQNGHTSVVNLLLDKGAVVDLPIKVRMILQVKLKPCTLNVDMNNYLE